MKKEVGETYTQYDINYLIFWYMQNNISIIHGYTCR